MEFNSLQLRQSHDNHAMVDLNWQLKHQTRWNILFTGQSIESIGLMLNFMLSVCWFQTIWRLYFELILMKKMRKLLGYESTVLLLSSINVNTKKYEQYTKLLTYF